METQKKEGKSEGSVYRGEMGSLCKENPFINQNNTFNITFNEQTGLYSQGQQVPSSSVADPVNPNTWVITLNNYNISSIGTREAWAEAILHEVIHGFIKMNNLDFTGTTTWHDAHAQMLDCWVLQIRDALTELFSGLSGDDALALALGGMDDVLKEETSDTFRSDMVDWVQNHYGVSLSAAEATATQYWDQTKGHVCN